MKSKLHFALFASLGINLALLVALIIGVWKFPMGPDPKGPFARDLERIEEKLGLDTAQRERIDTMFRQTGEKFDNIHRSHLDILFSFIDAPEDKTGREKLLEQSSKAGLELERELFSGVGEIIMSLTSEQKAILREELLGVREHMMGPRPNRKDALKL